jgi:hypothetical protein
MLYLCLVCPNGCAAAVCIAHVGWCGVRLRPIHMMELVKSNWIKPINQHNLSACTSIHP